MTTALSTEEAPASTNNPWVMAGTEGTREYHVLARHGNCRIGFRVLPNGVRVRIEPSSAVTAVAFAKHFLATDGWKQPEGDLGGRHFRFSKVVPMGDESVKLIEMVIATLAKYGKLERNTSKRLWRGLVR